MQSQVKNTRIHLAQIRGAYMNRILLIILLFLQTTLFADTVTLKNGKTFENVKANLLRTEVQFTHEDKLLSFKKKEIRSIRLKPVLLKPPANDLERLEYERERVRVAEALQSTTDWEMSANSKPAVAILQLSPGSGVTVAEVESVTNLIRTSLVKTKLFVVLDTSTIAKDCSQDVKDCTNKIGANVKLNKVVTGTITKIGNKYYINGNVLDSKKNNTIDFAEKATADSPEKLEDAAEYFAKKVAGGIMEFWGEAVQAKEQETYANLKYVWRSALLPGLGQWQYSEDKEDNTTKNESYLFGGIAILLTANLFLQVQTRDKYQKAYSESHRNFFLSPLGSGAEILFYSVDNDNYSKYEKSHILTINSAFLLIGFYLYNVVDAFFLGKPYFNKETTSRFFLIPSMALVNGSKENNYILGVNFQF